MAFSVFLPDLPAGKRNMPPRIPLTSYRHAGPSGPWPWADMVEDDNGLLQPVPDMHMPGAHAATPNCDSQRAAWREYPTNLFPNWEGSRLVRSGIAGLITKKPVADCVVYYVDVEKSGVFSKAVGQYRVANDRPDEFLGDLEVRTCVWCGSITDGKLSSECGRMKAG